MTTWYKMLSPVGIEITTVAWSDDGNFALTDPSATDANSVAFQAWLAAGNKLPDAAARPPWLMPPTIVTRYQLLQGLTDPSINKRSDWLAAVAAAKQSVQDYWGGKIDFPSDSPKLARLATTAGVDIAALFATAAAL